MEWPFLNFTSMGYVKFRAGQLFDGYRFLADPSVLVMTEEGVVETILPADEAGDDVQELSGIISPGFINCHCHLELSHMKDMIEEGTGLGEFVFRVVTQRNLPDEAILAAIEKAEGEMLANGIVAVGDICNNALSLPQKLKGRIWYHNFIEASGFNPAIAAERFQRSTGFFAAYANLYSIPVASNSITPHAPYSVSDELWEMILHFPGNQLLTIHNQETADEDEWFKYKTGSLQDMFAKMKMDTTSFQPSGKSSLQTYFPKFLANQAVILVHNVHTKREHIDFAKQSGIIHYWCFCPNANEYISGKLPAIDLFTESGNIVLGTDSLASNHQLSILEEMKTIRKHYPGIELGTLLQWATLNGAKALQLQALMGSFEKGKKPGVLLIADNLETVKRLL